MSAFVTHIWTSTLFLAVVMLAARLLPLTARTRYVLLLCGLFKFAVPGVAIVAPLRLIGIDLDRLVQRPAGTVTMQWLTGPAQFTAPPTDNATDWWLIAAAIWIASATLLALVWAVARRRLVNSALAATSVASPRERQALTTARHALRLNTSIDIRRSTICEAPAVVRVIRPVVVLPDGGCDLLDDSELESLLRHECAHVARRDNLIGLGESAVVAAFWFHPLVWLAQRDIAAAREEACDEVAAASPSSVDTFVSALTKICSALVAPRLAGVSCMASAHLKERLNHLMTYETLRHRALPHRFVTALAAIAVVCIAAGSGLSAASATGSTASAQDRYRLLWSVRPGPTADHWTFRGTVVDASNDVVLTQPSFDFRHRAKGKAQASTETSDGQRSMFIDVRDTGTKIEVELRVLENGVPVQTTTYSALPQSNNKPRNAVAAMEAPQGQARRYTGEKITMNLANADLKDVLKTFASLTNVQVQFSPELQGRVTVSVIDMPWDEAFDLVLRQNGLSYEIKDGIIFVK